MERASRVIVVASTALAVAVHVWLATRWQPLIFAAAAIAFVVAFALARASLPAALITVLAAAYVAPGLLALAFGAPDYHLIIVWLAAVAGVVFAHTNLRQWHVPSGWTIPLAGWALVIAITWPIIAAREVDFSLAAVGTLDAAQGIFGGPPPLAAAFVVIFALAQLLGILFLDLLWARFSTSTGEGLTRSVIVPFIAGAVIGSLVAIYQGLGDITWLNPFWATLERAGGLVHDANTLGTGAAIWGPVAIAAAWHTGRHVWPAMAACGVLSLGMWQSGSRTALLVFIAGAAGLVIGALKRRSLWQPGIGRLVVIGAATAAVAAALVLAPREGDSSSGLGRALGRLPRLESADFKRFADEMWRRFDYGPAAAQIIAEHPFTGIGIGAFHVIAPDYIYKASGGDRRVAADNAQNWWRHQVAELGFVGALPSLSLSLAIAWLLLRSQPPDRLGASTVLRLVLLGVGAASLLGVPTQHPATLLSVAAVLFFFVAATPREASVDRARTPLWWAAAVALAGVTVAGQTITATRELRVPRRIASLGMPYVYGASAPEGLSEDGELRWAGAKAVAVLPVQQRWLQLTIWHPDPRARQPVTVRATLDGRPAFEHSLLGEKPLTYYLEAPTATPSIVLELSAAPVASPHALRMAWQWRHAPPNGASADQVIGQ